jgi:hypothetical protein
LGGLIKVQNDTVYLVHQSIKKYLKETNLIPAGEHSLQPNKSNLHNTISCLTYLSFREHPALASHTNSSFFQYSSTYWPEHMRKLNEKLQRKPELKTAFLYLSKTESNLRLAWRIYALNTSHRYYISTPSMMAVCYGITSLVQFLLMMMGRISMLALETKMHFRQQCGKARKISFVYWWNEGPMSMQRVTYTAMHFRQQFVEVMKILFVVHIVFTADGRQTRLNI